MTNHEWRTQAACRNHPQPDIFFPDPGDHTTRKQAKAICNTCPVQQPCRQEAKRLQTQGIWGNKTHYGRGGHTPNTPCGTTNAARRHQRAGEPLCHSCQQAITRARQDQDNRARGDR